MEHNFDVAGPVEKATETAHKAIGAALTAAGTYAAVLVADLNDAAGWVNQLLVVAGGAVSTAVVYWKKNHPKV